MPPCPRGALVVALTAGLFACSGDQELAAGPSLAKGGNTPPLAVSPTSVILSLTSATQATLTAKAQASGTINAATSDAACATVSPANAVATKPMGSSVYVASFTVTPVGTGSCAITLSTTSGAEAQTQVVVSAVELRAQTLVGSDRFTCGLTASGAAYCWGRNQFGQLGTRKNIGTDDPNPTPAAVSGNLTFVSLTAGWSHACGLTSAGAAYCWGANGALGSTKRLGPTNVSSTPIAVEGGHKFVALTAGNAHTCGVTDTGAAYCWGLNYFGQLGNPTNSGVLGVGNPTPLAVSGGQTFVAIAAGADHTCALTPLGAAWCWGDNTYLALGNPSISGTVQINPTPTAVAGGLTFAALTAGNGTTCGLTDAGAAYCWGTNSSGQLGTAADLGVARASPEAVSGGLQFTEIRAGGVQTCGLTSGGVGYCWGSNLFGELGTTTNAGVMPSNNPTPEAVGGGLTFATLATGVQHTCGVTVAGAAYCWGENSEGQLGNTTNIGTFEANPTPGAVLGGITFAAP
jgi:alpha-tubulin suppressor-like RCC1 family protein